MIDTCGICGQTIGYDCGCTEIERLTAERDRYKARAERAEEALKGMLNHVQDEVFAKGRGEVYQADIGPAVDASRATLAQIDAEPAKPRQPKVQEAARVLLKSIPYNEDAIEAVQTKTRPTDFIASLRALAEGDNQ